MPLAVFALLTGGALLGLWLRYPHERLGLCNVVTHFRSTLVALAAAPLAVPAAFHAQERLAWTALSIAVVALALDGFDGWLARRSGLSSDFGARFDVEVDAALALILALLVWQADKVGPWIMVLGLARYAFVAGVGLVTWLRAPLPPRLRRKVICVVQLGALIALLAPPVQPPFAQLLASVAALLLVWSFSMDIAWLWRRRNPS
ncbi:CDP-alcohol phosphatidyltransferase family protein [Rhodobacteraceae bacterium MCCB 386]|nr:CDP-alcohol phosphatidyltransferase family protein [Roseitranquillus sediminis]